MTSYWLHSAQLPSYPSLSRSLTVDVGIIGGGIVGITAAYLLKSAGLTVALLERGRCTHGDTGHTTAHLTMVTDLSITDLVQDFGAEAARAVWDAGRIAIDQIESHVRNEEIACDFRRVPGHLHQALKGDGATAEELTEDARQARTLGFDAEFVERVPWAAWAGIVFPGQALFHPVKYLGALLRTIPGDGSHVFEHAAADEIVDEPLAIKSGGHTVSCDYVVMATHNPLMGKTSPLSATLFQTKLALYTSYAIGGKLPSGAVPHGLYWDTADPYHYVRVEPRPEFDYAIVGGEDHKTGQVKDTRECFAALETTAQALMPDLAVTDRWSGQVIETHDGLPYIGEISERQFVATGFAGNGMTFGTLAAMMARDAAVGRTNPWSDLLAVNRKSVSGAWDYLQENKDYLLYLVRDRFAGAQGASVRVLRRGEGKILNVNNERAAAYRDSNGCVIIRSAICTHMGCEVKWNQAEATWDCPCHGSRFTPDGAVLAGPAESPLAALNGKEHEADGVPDKNAHPAHHG